MVTARTAKLFAALILWSNIAGCHAEFPESPVNQARIREDEIKAHAPCAVDSIESRNLASRTRPLGPGARTAVAAVPDGRELLILDNNRGEIRALTENDLFLDGRRLGDSQARLPQCDAIGARSIVCSRQ